MRLLTLFILAISFSGVSFFSTATMSCEAPIIISPAQHAVVYNATPTIVWVADKKALANDLSVDSRIPEAEIIVRQSHVMTTSSFTPINALTNSRAIVTARLQTRCNDNKLSTFSDITFHIDLSKSCKPPRIKNLIRHDEMWEISWDEDANINRVEGRIFSGSEAAPGPIVAANRPHLKILSSKGTRQIIGLRSDCRYSKSSWVWLMGKQ